jgi:hypothetical protein
MTYRGDRSRELDTEQGRVFEVSKVRLAPNGGVADVLWVEVNPASGLDVGADVLATEAEVIDAIHDGASVLALFKAHEPPLRKRNFVIALQQDGSERIAFAGPPIPGRALEDVARIDELEVGAAISAEPDGRPSAADRGRIHAVTRVGLDAEGRIVEVFWGTVDPKTNSWRTSEVVAPVELAVDALLAGDQVFALFPSLHGHLPDREFVVADYDGARRTIVLKGPAAHEREVHDMDRLPASG